MSCQVHDKTNKCLKWGRNETSYAEEEIGTENDASDDDDDSTVTQDKEDYLARQFDDEEYEGVVIAHKHVLWYLRDTAGIPSCLIHLDSQ